MLTEKQISDIASSITKDNKAFIEELRDGKVFGEVPVLSDILYGTVELIGCVGSSLLFGLEEVATLFLSHIFGAVSKVFFKPFYEQMLDVMYKIADKTDKDYNKINEMDDLIQVFGDYQYIFGVLATVNNVMQYLGDINKVYNAKTQQGVLDKIRPNLMDKNDLIRMFYVDPEKRSKVFAQMGLQGFTDADIDDTINVNQNQYNEDQLRDLYYRQIINDDRARKLLSVIGYSDDKIDEIIQSWPVIPSIQDILTLISHEAFEPDQIEKYGLMDEFPTEQQEWLDKQGLSRYWQEKYWSGHWSFPALEKVYEMLHRGKLTRDEMYQYFKIVEIPPYWREKLMDISYRPYTRVDTRRMHALGVLNDDQLLQAYRDQGYDDEKAFNMVLFTKQYNQSGDKRLTRAQIESYYKQGILNESDTRTFFIDNDYSPASADLMIKKLNIDIANEYIKEVLKVTEQQYINNQISSGDVYSNLNQLGIQQDKINHYINKWNLRKVKIIKLPNRQELDDMYINDVIDERKYKEKMYANGYSEEDINNYLRLISIKQTTGRK